MYVNASHVSNLDLRSENSITWVIDSHLPRKSCAACACAQVPKGPQFQRARNTYSTLSNAEKPYGSVCSATFVGWGGEAQRDFRAFEAWIGAKHFRCGVPLGRGKVHV